MIDMEFDFYIGGYGRDTYRLKLDGSMLRCSEYQGLPTEHDKLINLDGSKDWELLIGFLRTCDWKKRYDDNSICDGTQWELKAKGEGFNINSYGSNSYPDNFDKFFSILGKILTVAGIDISK